MGWSVLDTTMMRRALSLARRALGKTSPNPPVGAVIVRDGRIVGEGYHKKAGGPHAEVNAIRAAGDGARGGTIYVTLEPCNHTGRTPPCTRAVLEAGIKEVVIGCLDPNPRVEGGGGSSLRAMGVKVRTGCLEEECMGLIAPFAKHVSTGMPWVVAKVAASLDGKIATRTGDSKWITNEEARRRGHKLRAVSDAILVGRGTVEADDPLLTCRGVRGANPLRVVLDSRLSLSPRFRIFDTSEAGTVVFCRDTLVDSAAASRLMEMGVSIEGGGPGPKIDPEKVLRRLGALGVQVLLVEGGGEIHGAFFDAGIVDEAVFFLAPVVIGGTGAPSAIKGKGAQILASAPRMNAPVFRRIGDNLMVQGRFTDPARFWKRGDEACLPG